MFPPDVCTKSKQKRTGAPWYTRRIPKRDDETARKDVDIADDSFPRPTSTTPRLQTELESSPSDRKFSREGRFARKKGEGAVRRWMRAAGSREPEIVQLNYRRTAELHG